MPHSVSMLLCAAVACAAFAAPAPVYRTPRASGVWVDGWDDPVVLIGNCRFASVGDKLTVRATAPGPRGGQKHATAQLLREVVGDFDMEARVSIETQRYLEDSPATKVSAGLRIEVGRNVALAAGLFAFVEADIWPRRGPARVRVCGMLGVPRSRFAEDGVKRGKPVRLRLTRRGHSASAAYCLDGVEWKTKELPPGGAIKLPARLKVGVIVESVGGGRAVFDQFKLTHLK